jgi:hypothetical protein
MSQLLPRRLAPALLSIALVLGGLPARASFHLFSMNELYTNGDGSVQFMEMTALTGAQEFVAGHTLVATSGATTHTFQVPANLPGDTSGRKVLFATQGFADLGLVTPDYIVPNGFFFQGGGTLRWGEGADVWNYPALPTDGQHSIERTGTQVVNSPQNFAGATASIGSAPPPPQSFNVQDLWWASPAGSEAGWGVNITHQGDILFATWFTYGADGNGLWLVMSAGAKTGPNTYSGTLYQTTGPSFDSAAFDPAQVKATPVGNATFAFADPNNGTFSYTVNGISQTKNITRTVYASPVPTCSQEPILPSSGGIYGSGTPNGPNYQDLWWKSPAASESGWGVNLTHQGNILFATWFTYDASGKGMWLVMSAGTRVANTETFSGALYRTTGPAFNASPWDPHLVTQTPVGTASFSFVDADNGTFTYTVNGVTQTKSITRDVYATPKTNCQ